MKYKNMITRNFIEDSLTIDERNIPIEFVINNWGEPFNRPLLKEEIIKIIKNKDIDSAEIKKIKVSCSLHSYTDSTGSVTPSIEDIKISVELLNGETKEFFTENGFIPG